MKTLAETMEELKGLQKRAQIISLLPILLCVLAAILMIVKLPSAGGMVAGVALVLYFSYVRTTRASYSDAVAAANIRFGLCEGLEDAAYTDREGLTLQGLKEMSLLPLWAKSSLLVRQGFSARSGALTLRGWEMTSNYPEPSGKKTGYTFFSGTVLQAVGGTSPETDLDVLLIRKGLFSTQAEEELIRSGGFRICGCPEELGKDFHVYTRGDPDQLPAHWAKRLRKLAEDWPTLGSLRLSPQQAAAYLRGRFYTESVKPGFLPSQDQFQHNPLPERDGMWELFRYWGSGGKS